MSACCLSRHKFEIFPMFVLVSHVRRSTHTRTLSNCQSRSATPCFISYGKLCIHNRRPSTGIIRWYHTIIQQYLILRKLSRFPRPLLVQATISSSECTPFIQKRQLQRNLHFSSGPSPPTLQRRPPAVNKAIKA